MRYLVLCCDYDGTLATEGEVFPHTVAALKQLTASGRRAVLVTGRELDELRTVCPCLDQFEYVVAENGALLYQPSTRSVTPLAQRPPDSFVAALRARGIERISVGRVIVATWEPHETTVLETIRDQGLELQVIFNKGAVMVLPAGVNKATGLAAALQRMGLSAHNAVGVGDAENDHALLALCECGVAVANALPTLKQNADFVTVGARGEGVSELIAELVHDDLASREENLTRHHISIGTDSQGHDVRIGPYGHNLLVLGVPPDSSGLAQRLLEALCGNGYTFCLIDPEATYESLAGAVSLGSAERPPTSAEVIKLFRNPQESAIVGLTGLPPAQRSSFCAALLSGLGQLRERSGLPHWLLFDEADQLFPADPTASATAPPAHTVLQITSHPNLLARARLTGVDLLIVTGASPRESVQAFCVAAGLAMPRLDFPAALMPGEALAWRPRERSAAPFKLNIAPVHTAARQVE